MWIKKSRRRKLKASATYYRHVVLHLLKCHHPTTDTCQFSWRGPIGSGKRIVSRPLLSTTNSDTHSLSYVTANLIRVATCQSRLTLIYIKIIKNIKLFLKIFQSKQSSSLSLSIYPESPRLVFPSIKLGFNWCLCVIQVSVFWRTSWLFRRLIGFEVSFPAESSVKVYFCCLSAAYWRTSAIRVFSFWSDWRFFSKKVSLLHQSCNLLFTAFLLLDSTAFRLWSFEKFLWNHFSCLSKLYILDAKK